MKYIEAKIFTNSRGVEEVTAELLKMGIEGATVEDPDEIKNIMDKKAMNGTMLTRKLFL